MARSAKRFRLQIHTELCKGCALCVAFCPHTVLRLTIDRINRRGVPFVEATQEDSCVGCAHCAIVCPDGAIEIFEREQEGHG